MRKIVLALVVSLFSSVLPALAQPAAGDDKEVRIVGCVQLENNHSRNPNEFVLTMVKPEGGRKATAYGITGDRAKELGRRVGQQVEVIGVIESEGSNDDLPRIKMSAWVPVKDSCPAS